MSATLYGYIDTSMPGHRTVEIGGVEYTVSPGYYRGDELVAALDTALSPASWSAALTAAGLARIIDDTATGATVTWTDRLGAALGMGLEAGASEPGSPRSVVGQLVPRVAIPLAGAQWVGASVERESQLDRGRSGRGAGYVWGGVRVWRWRLTLSASSLEALRAGWCLRGQVTIEGAESDPMSPMESRGSVTGHVVSVSDARWLGPDGVRQWAEVTMSLAVSL